MQYEVIMTDIGHTMQRDGEFIVFGDVMFGLPNNGRSRISSYGEGPDKQSARQSVIERAIEHLYRDERMSAKRQPQDFVYYAESNKSKKKPSKSAAPVEVVNNRSGFFDDEQDKEYFGFGFIVGGIIVGVLGTIFLGRMVSSGSNPPTCDSTRLTDSFSCEIASVFSTVFFPSKNNK